MTSNNQPTPDLAKLYARAQIAEGRELDALAASAFEDKPKPCRYHKTGMSLLKMWMWTSDRGWIPRTFSASLNTVAATLEAEIERRGLLGKYMETLGHMVLPESHLGFPINRFEVGKMVTATALQRTRAAVLTAIRAKMDRPQPIAKILSDRGLPDIPESVQRINFEIGTDNPFGV